MDYKAAFEKLEAEGQTALLRFYDDLNERAKEKLLREIEDINFDAIKNIKNDQCTNSYGKLSPIKILSLSEKEHRRKCSEIGMAALRGGKLGIVILSGGQGSRLGYSHAKGMYNIGITRELSVFEIHMSQFVRWWRNDGVKLHCFIMTSSQNNEEIQEFFEINRYFGYDKDFVHFFVQSNNYPLTFDGKLLLSKKDTVCKAACGNGLWYRELVDAGCRALLEREGIEWLSVVSVDNVLQKFIDPVFLGAVAEAGAVSGAKVVKKSRPDEKTGTICLKDGKPAVIEYFELERYFSDREASLSPAFSYGAILNYLFKVTALDAVDFSRLLVHTVSKKMPYVDDNGITTVPSENNVHKHEYLTTDLIEHMQSCVAFEIDRQSEFAPLKNLSGDASVETARRALEAQGVEL